MGVGEDFGTFCRDLSIRDRDIIGQRYRLITRRMNLQYWDTQSDTAHSFYTGSYGRGTAIDLTSDVDMIFQLPNAVYWQYANYSGNGPSALLQAVRSAIRVTYPATEIGADGHVVVVPFGDGINSKSSRLSVAKRGRTSSRTLAPEALGAIPTQSQKLMQLIPVTQHAMVTLSGSGVWHGHGKHAGTCRSAVC